DLRLARAHWVARDTIAWNAGDANALYRLHFAPDGGLQLEPTSVTGGQVVSLTHDPDGLSAPILAKFPHLRGYAALKLSQPDLSKAPAILKGQVAVSVCDSTGVLLDATSLQIAGALDDLYQYDGPLGVSFTDGAPMLRVWAPTAHSVDLF